MDKFWILLEKSTLVSGAIAIMMIATVCYCVVMQIPLPEYFTFAFAVVVGFFFGAKTQKEGSARTG